MAAHVYLEITVDDVVFVTGHQPCKDLSHALRGILLVVEGSCNNFIEQLSA
jgi:hypothetical protein